jgi:hypothetical protein
MKRSFTLKIIALLSFLKGGHGVNDFDWQQFIAFADRHFGIAEIENIK